jgi:hypothetical protein
LIDDNFDGDGEMAVLKILGIIILLVVAGGGIWVIKELNIKRIYKALSILLIIAIVIGILSIPDLQRRQQRNESKEYYTVYAELVMAYQSFPVDESAEVQPDCRMVYCRFDEINKPNSYEGHFTKEYIPKKNQPKSPDDSDAIIVACLGQDEVARYTNGMVAYQQFYTLTVIDVHEQTIIYEGKVYGSKPSTPSQTTSRSHYLGSIPSDNALKEYIDSLISGKLP